MADSGSSPIPPDAPRRLWTRDEWARAGELGVFPPGERLELVAGEVIRKMTPQSARHATAVTKTSQALQAAFRAATVRVQLPLALGPRDEPEPDVCVVAGTPDDFVDAHPNTALLVVEIADASLPFDRSVKASLYARAGIGEYWIVNLRDQVLEVHREPAPMADQPFGHAYRSIARLTERDTVEPVAAAASVRVSDLLP